jgi:topoisomerase-4 subunit A
MIHLEKWHPNHAISAVYFDGAKSMHYVKRFLCEVTSDKRVGFIGDADGSGLSCFSTAYQPEITIIFNKQRKETKNLPDKVLSVHEFIDVKGMKAQGNQLTKHKVKEVLLNHEVNKGVVEWPDSTDSGNPNESQSKEIKETVQVDKQIQTSEVKPKVKLEKTKSKVSKKEESKKRGQVSQKYTQKTVGGEINR